LTVSGTLAVLASSPHESPARTLPWRAAALAYLTIREAMLLDTWAGLALGMLFAVRVAGASERSARAPNVETLRVWGRQGGSRRHEGRSATLRAPRRTSTVSHRVGLLARERRILRTAHAFPEPRLEWHSTRGDNVCLQWRDRAGLAPASLLCPCGHPKLKILKRTKSR
jgi:hypothetical protein